MNTGLFDADSRLAGRLTIDGCGIEKSSTSQHESIWIKHHQIFTEEFFEGRIFFVKISQHHSYVGESLPSLILITQMIAGRAGQHTRFKHGIITSIGGFLLVAK